MGNRWENNDRLYFFGSKITAGGDCSHEIKDPCSLEERLRPTRVLSHFSWLCPTLCDPTDRGQPGPLSMGFSREEHWSGLPFPSPAMKYEASEVKSLSRV